MNANTSDTPEQESNLKKHYVTPLGARLLQEEFKKLKSVERPEVVKVVEWAAGNGDRSENGDYTYGKKRLREIDRRLAFLSKRLETMQVIDPKSIKSEKVLFGATVTFRDEEDVEKTFSIVGIDEADVAKKKISWVSPLAKALFNAKAGDYVQFNSPKGMRDLEIVAIEYNDLSS